MISTIRTYIMFTFFLICINELVVAQNKECSECDGRGKIECDYCEGSGRIYTGVRNTTTECTRCSKNSFFSLGRFYPEGVGRVKCGYCEGTGIIEGEVYVTSESNSSSFSFDLQGRVGNIRYSQIKIFEGDRVNIFAEGKVVFGFFAGAADPNGFTNGSFKSYNVVRGADHGSLLCRIGTRNDEWILVGTETSFVAHEDGYLELLINDRDKDNNSGSFEGIIQIQRN